MVGTSGSKPTYICIDMVSDLLPLWNSHNKSSRNVFQFQPALSFRKHIMCEHLIKKCDLMLGIEEVILKRIIFDFPFLKRCQTVKLLCKSLKTFEAKK
jgi:hypothetical protein